MIIFFFFFSSRRRHTRWTGDWSSDVCSSDLFQAYAGSDAATLDRFITKGFVITGLGSVVTYDSIQGLYIPQGGSERDITVTVRWQLPGQSGVAPATLDVTYDMTWIFQGGNWSIETISGSTQQAGQQQ